MKNIADVIRNKEQEILTIRKQLDALRIVAPLLADDPLDSKSRVLEMPENDDLIDMRVPRHPTA